MTAVNRSEIQPSLTSRLTESRGFLSAWFMLPTAVLLLVFLTYPLGLGVWLGFTDARVGRDGVFIGLENYEYLWDDAVFWLSVFNTLLYTISASILKFALGLWLALLLNENLPLKAFFRAVVLLPWVVPTVLSAIAFWWIYDSQFSILSWALIEMGIIDERINFLGDPTNARASVIAANVWRGIPFVAITLLAGLQTIPQSLYEAATLDGASSLAALPFRHAALADADHRDHHDLLGPVHLHRFPADLRADARWAGERHASDGHALLPARHFGRTAGRGRSDRGGDDPLPAGRDPVQLFRTAAPQMAAGRRRLRWRSPRRPSRRPATKAAWATCRACRAAW